MIKIENVDTMGWEQAVRGMRNPMNSWDKSDSKYIFDEGDNKIYVDNTLHIFNDKHFKVGDEDKKLMKKLANAGPDHRKYLRMITIYMDITAPLYWWKEFDTYKIGTVANSCSTMHKIHDKEFTIDDFSHEHLFKYYDDCSVRLCFNNKEDFTSPGFKDRCLFNPIGFLELTVQMLESLRNQYNVTKDKRLWWQMIQLLPSSYNQRRTVMLNYEIALNMYNNRNNHKLDEWEHLRYVFEQLPMFKELVNKEEN